MKRSIGKYSININKFIHLCSKNKTINQITGILKLTRRTIDNYRIKTGINPVSGIRKPNLDYEFFSKIDIEEKAYILGFLYADGYVCPNERTVSLNIHKKDIDILYKIKKYMRCGNNIRKSTTPNCIMLNLCSVQMVRDLNKLGMYRNKSLTIDFPKLSKDMYKPFLRGYFDGDGYVGERQCVLVSGSDKFFNGFIEFIESKFNKPVYKVKIKNCNRAVFSRKDKDIINWLYRDAKVYLDRKFRNFNKYWV